MGGADTPFATAHKRGAAAPPDRARSRSSSAKLFPAIRCDVDWRWGGTFGETEDGLPYIGTVRQFPHGYFALGYGGNGITFSWIAAEHPARPFPRAGRIRDAELFRFDR